MEAFAKFIESEAFFPVLILLLVMLLLVFVWVLMSGKNEEKKRRAKQKRAVDESAEIKIVQEDIVNVSIEELMNAEENNKVETNIELNEEKEIKEETISNTVMPEITVDIPTFQEEVYIPKIDLPINQMDETPITVNVEKNLQSEETGETVELPRKEVNYHEDIKENEIINVPKMEEYKETEIGEQFEIPVEQASYEEVKEDEIAFNSTPTEEKEINEDIIVPKTEEYISEKTEIFDFPNFDSIDENVSKDIEDDIIEAANKYIESIMKR